MLFKPISTKNVMQLEVLYENEKTKPLDVAENGNVNIYLTEDIELKKGVPTELDFRICVSTDDVCDAYIVLNNEYCKKRGIRLCPESDKISLEKGAKIKTTVVSEYGCVLAKDKPIFQLAIYTEHPQIAIHRICDIQNE